MKHIILVLIAASAPVQVFAQQVGGGVSPGQTTTQTQAGSTPNPTQDATTEKKEPAQPQPIAKGDFERPFNFFAAAGAAYMFNEQYSVAVSPVDNTVQFEKTYPILTRFSLGLVWNPFPNQTDANQILYFKNKRVDLAYKAARNHAAVALLVNVFQLGYSAGEINTTSPIDVGFGVGYRSENFMVLGTLEFTPIRSPRSYFTERFKDKNQTLLLAGTTEPVRTISLDDNSIFVNRIYPSIGIKMAYAFSKQKVAVKSPGE